MRVIRLIFSRFFIVSLLVVVQVGAFISLILFLDIITPYYYLVNLGFSIIGIFIVLVLIGRNINPNYIVPWIVIILLMPVPGVALYLMFSQNRLRHGEKAKYRRLHESGLQFVRQSGQVDEALAAADLRAAGQSRYIASASKLPVYDNTFAKYFSTGESFFAALKEELERAESFIFLEYFIIQEGLMLGSVLEILQRKIESGVEVRLMYDDIGSIGKVKSGYYKKLRAMGIKCVKFNKYLPVISAVHNNRDHRKIVVIDGKTAFIGGANIADEYINVVKIYGYWKDSAVMLKGQAVRSVTLMFLQMFGAQGRTAEDFSPYLTEQSGAADVSEGDGVSHSGFIQPFGDGPMPLYLEKVGQTAIQNMVAQAERYVYITTPYLIIDFQMTEALKSAAKRGVDVRIVTPHIADSRIIHMMTRATYRALVEAGVRIFEYSPGFMHAKNFIADGRVAIVGTMNMDYRSFVHHFECGVWLFDSPCVTEIEQDIEAVLTLSHEVSLSECRLNPLQRVIKLVLELFAPLL